MEIDKYGARIVAHEDFGKTFIDEAHSGEIDYDIVRERKKLGFSGMISLVVTIDKDTKKLKGEPQITVQGVAGIDLLNGMLKDARETVADAVAAMKREDFNDKNWAKENLRIHLKRFIQKETGTKPVIVPTLVEV